MSYAGVESSLDQGRPIELYRFVRGSEEFRFTSHHETVTYQIKDYQPAQCLRDSPIIQTVDINKDLASFKFPRENSFARDLAVFNADSRTDVYVYRQHYGDGETVQVWMGTVATTSMSDNTVTVNCVSPIQAARRNGFRWRYQRTCPHTLWDQWCGLDKNAYAVAGTVAAAPSPVQVTVNAAAGYPAGYFSGGEIMQAGRSRTISSHSGSSLVLLEGITLAAGQAVTLFPGCNRTYEECSTKFNNQIHFGGFRWIPDKNPMEVSLT